MKRKTININGYWKVIVYYDVDYNFFDYIEDDVLTISSPVEKMFELRFELKYNAYAVTITNTNKHISIVCFNKHDNIFEYLNSIIHELEHIKEDILFEYGVENKGEPPAYLIGYLFMQMIL